MNNIELILSECQEAMTKMPDSTFDSIVCDPPYGIAFMGSKWDNYGQRCGDATVDERRQIAEDYAEAHAGAPRYGNSRCDTRNSRREGLNFQAAMTPIFAKALRVAKPGAYMCCFGSPRTYHRLTCAIEDAGWNVVDCVMFVHGQGFPKGLDISKAIDKRFGAKREVIGTATNGSGANRIKIENHGPGDTGIGKWDGSGKVYDVTAPASADAKKWDGWNTQLKPAYEPIVIAQKPVEKTIIDNVLRHGTGSFNVDACRVPTEDNLNGGAYAKPHDEKRTDGYRFQTGGGGEFKQPTGRYPANLVHDGSPEVLALFPDTGKSKGGGGVKYVGTHVYDGGYKGKNYDTIGFMDSGSAARFFYCAKPSRKERGEGNFHPTVKSVALMRWLVRLVTRRGGLVLDPFMGSGTTGIAALQEGMRFVGIERDAKYMEIARRRIAEAQADVERARSHERHDFIQQELLL